MLSTITALPPDNVPMPEGVYLDQLWLVRCAGEWHLAVWGGAEWHDADSGEPLTPQLVANLPAITSTHISR